MNKEECHVLKEKPQKQPESLILLHTIFTCLNSGTGPL